MNALEEYGIPNGNGHTNGNGNGNGKIFHLKPATDPDTLAILDARRKVLAEPKERLSRSMKACFCEVLDRALNPSCYDSKGVVTISDTVLGEIFSVSNRTVYTWKKKIEACGHWWITKKFKSNMWPLTTYHLTCLHKPHRTDKTDSDGTFGRGRNYKPAPPNPGQGARKPGQPGLPLPGSRQAPPPPENENLPIISGETREKLPVSPEENFGWEPKKTSGESRNKFRVAPEENFGSDPKKTSGESRRKLRVAPEADFRHLETQNRVTGVPESKRLGKRAGAASGDGKTAPPMTARQRESENDFLALCHQVFGAKEMEANGGLWRQFFRQHKAKAWAVLHETLACKKDRPHTLKTTWAQFAMDMWVADRLKYDAA